MNRWHVDIHRSWFFFFLFILLVMRGFGFWFWLRGLVSFNWINAMVFCGQCVSLLLCYSGFVFMLMGTVWMYLIAIGFDSDLGWNPFFFSVFLNGGIHCFTKHGSKDSSRNLVILANMEWWNPCKCKEQVIFRLLRDSSALPWKFPAVPLMTKVFSMMLEGNGWNFKAVFWRHHAWELIFKEIITIRT